MSQRTFLVTGASRGLGHALAQCIREDGDFVIATFRDRREAEAFTQESNGWGVVMDLSQPSSIDRSVAEILESHPRIDVLINNAGYGLIGAVEETSDEEVRSIFEVNVFGALRLTNHILPVMRVQQFGHIIQISSHGGFKAFGGFGIYNATKFALEGFSEALFQEVQPHGIHVTLVEPGPLRTDFAGHSLKLAKRELSEYAATSGVMRKRMTDVNGKQPGDPMRAAQVILEITRMNAPPLRLPLGKTALQSLQSKMEQVSRDMAQTSIMAASIDFQ